MNNFNSSIKKKKCKCSPDCDKWPSTSFGGYYYSHAPQKIRDEQGLKSKKGYQNKLSKQKQALLSRKLHQVADSPKKQLSGRNGEIMTSQGQKTGNKRTTKPELRSTLLKTADSLFSKYIRERDAINGEIQCVGCGRSVDLKSKDGDGNLIAQNLHFVPRTVYSLRFSEINCHSGCSVCNLDMALNPEGRAYQHFRSFLVNSIGEADIQEMEAQKRNINKLSNQDIREIIKKYQ